MDETLGTLGRTVAEALGPAVSGYAIAHHELTVQAEARDIVSDFLQGRYSAVVDTDGIYPS